MHLQQLVFSLYLVALRARTQVVWWQEPFHTEPSHQHSTPPPKKKKQEPFLPDITPALPPNIYHLILHVTQEKEHVNTLHFFKLTKLYYAF